MKQLLFLPLVALTLGTTHAATFVLADDDFDGGSTSGNTLTFSNANIGVTTSVGDPTSSGHGNVAIIDTTVGGRWGEVRPGTQHVSLPAGTTPGVDTFSASYDIYVPSASTNFAGSDRFGIIVRWNIANAGNNSAFRSHTEPLAQDGWYNVSVTGTIPLLGSDGLTTTMASPIISFDENPLNAATGTTAYIDNFNLSVTGVPEPTAGVLGLFGGLLLLRRRR